MRIFPFGSFPPAPAHWNLNTWLWFSLLQIKNASYNRHLIQLQYCKGHKKTLAVQFSRIFFVTTLSYPHPKSDSLCPDTGASCTGHLQKSPNRLQSCRHRATPLHLAAVLLTTWGTTGHESWLLAWLPSEKRPRVFTTNPVTSLMFLMNFALC